MEVPLVDQFATALQIDPGYVDAHNSLGVLLAKRGNLNGAILEFQEALRLAPDNAEARGNLALALEEQQSRR